MSSSDLICVFDVETTGLPDPVTRYKASAMNTHLWPHIIEFAYVIVNIKTNKIVKWKNDLIKIPENVTLQGEEVHGISRPFLDLYGKRLFDVLCEFCLDSQDVSQLIAHNIDFDINMVRAECYRILNTLKPDEKVDFEPLYMPFNRRINNHTLKMVCTMKENKDVCKIVKYWDDGTKYHKWPTLLELHEHVFGTKVEDLHCALKDVLVCLKCHYKLTYKNDELTNQCNDMLEKVTRTE